MMNGTGMYRNLIAAVALVAVGGMSISELSAQAPATAAGKAAARNAIQRGATATILPGTPESAFTVIQGNALGATNGPLANRIVRLRDARLGRIVDSQVTDRSGLFTFREVDPGNYVVELVGNDQAVMAASEVLNVNAGQAMSAIVRLPFRIPPIAGIFGQGAGAAGATIPSAAATVLSVAADAGVLAQNVATTTSDLSPR
jgi:hypothetical protein